MAISNTSRARYWQMWPVTLFVSGSKKNATLNNLGKLPSELVFNSFVLLLFFRKKRQPFRLVDEGRRNGSLHDFAHIPWEDTPNVPKPPQRKKFLHKLLVKRLGYLPGVCGWDLRISEMTSNLGENGAGDLWWFLSVMTAIEKWAVFVPGNHLIEEIDYG